jgi:hypothetical protein
MMLIIHIVEWICIFWLVLVELALEQIVRQERQK